jgi:hypothetical protein
VTVDGDTHRCIVAVTSAMCIGFATAYVYEFKELAMPQARSGSGSSGSTSRSKKSSSSRSSAKKSSSSSRAKSSRSTTRKSSSGRSTARKSSGASRAKSASPADDARIEAVANRLRKLNERIIEAGRDAGETTLTSYEKALKAIASGIEKGPGSSDIDWISNLATAQAKFIRDVTSSWTSAARNVLK